MFSIASRDADVVVMLQVFLKAVRENEVETVERMLVFFRNENQFVNHRETTTLNAPLHTSCKLGYYVLLLTMRQFFLNFSYGNVECVV